MKIALIFTNASRRAEAAARDFNELYIPSPLQVYREVRAEMAAHLASVRADQEDFQAFLSDLGINRLERHSSARETIELYRASRPGRQCPW